jgi:hypothetical protein
MYSHPLPAEWKEAKFAVLTQAIVLLLYRDLSTDKTKATEVILEWIRSL